MGATERGYYHRPKPIRPTRRWPRPAAITKAKLYEDTKHALAPCAGWEAGVVVPAADFAAARAE